MAPDDDATTAKLQELDDAVGRAEAALSAAEDRQNAITEELSETPEQEADISRRVNETEGELALFREAVSEAEREFNDAWSEDDDEDQEWDGESLSLHDAKDIWLSHGMDEDYTFGYTVQELEREAGLD